MPSTMSAASANDLRRPPRVGELSELEKRDQALPPQVRARVTLRVDILDLGLRRNTAGVVCSQWLAPITAYEVEFAGPSCKLRALLMEEHLCTAAG